ncbi:transcriptional regulator TyrR [Idiomarina seosinensis]|uniref:HTH-type transcriptional regulatory protein TyrR n=1 Tax=Idiomarina seosinensis TaxID=281739 RepID=A0A432ZHG3_9GAMM|nr:transcriptional regulator TyrR [Idiomarina seosinensis]RUO77411.1 transcriptional regulator TyrR [Idiomarina seosinensis]
MRLEISCDDRLGICQDVLQILRDHEIDLRGIEVDPVGKIFLNFPELAFDDFSHLMPKIRRIPNVKDVKTIPYMPFEREHFEFDLLLSTLPDPVLSIDAKGRIDIINDAGAKLLAGANEPLKGETISQYIHGFSILRWLDNEPKEPTYEAVNIGLAEYHAQLLPIWVTAEDGNETFAGAVITCKSDPITANWQRGDNESAFTALLTEQPLVKQIIKDAQRMAELEAPLLIEGETGVGKELLAKACHYASARFDKPFLAINCAALPDNVAESELFGHGEGSLSDLSQRKTGVLEQAAGGTVLLDSVGEMSISLQAKLLRFLEDGVFRRIGEEKEVSVNVRIICTAQNHLFELVEQGRFREDLYYRLNVLVLSLPPLRERRNDVLLLAEHFIAEACKSLGRSQVKLGRASREKLRRYQWPGNIRQLENTMFRSVSMLEGDILEPQDIRLPEIQQTEDSLAVDMKETTLDEAVRHFESSILRRLYPSYPSTRQLAKRLGLSHTAVANKLREYGIGKQRKRSS